MTYIATQNDRLDSIFARFYGDLAQDSYERGYNAFVLANLHLINTPILSGGEIVNLPQFSPKEIENKIKGVWE